MVEGRGRNFLSAFPIEIIYFSFIIMPFLLVRCRYFGRDMGCGGGRVGLMEEP